MLGSTRRARWTAAPSSDLDVRCRACCTPPSRSVRRSAAKRPRWIAAAAESLPGVRRVMSSASGVVVVADHFWQALKARDALKIVWDPGPNGALDNAAISALLAKAAAAGAGLSAQEERRCGRGAQVGGQDLFAVYELPMLAHATMEPMNCTADVRDGRCDLYVGTQVQQSREMAAADAAGLKPGEVNVITTLLGGGFGRRLEVDFVPAAVEASKAVGAPVQARVDARGRHDARPVQAARARRDQRRTRCGRQAHRLALAHHLTVDHGAASIRPTRIRSTR